MTSPEPLTWPNGVLSAPRFQRYLAWASGNTDLALRRYQANQRLAGAVFEDLSTVEVAVRNAIAEQLHILLGPTWYDDPTGIFDLRTNGHLRQARKQVTDANHPVTSDRVVSQLMFGSWVGLIDRGGHRTNSRTGSRQSYERLLWTPGLRHAFPNGSGNRGHTHAPLLRLKGLRNRIAHHEPILDMPIQSLHNDATNVLSWVSTDAATWLRTTSRVAAVLAHNLRS